MYAFFAEWYSGYTSSIGFPNTLSPLLYSVLCIKPTAIWVREYLFVRGLASEVSNIVASVSVPAVRGPATKYFVDEAVVLSFLSGGKALALFTPRSLKTQNSYHIVSSHSLLLNAISTKIKPPRSRVSHQSRIIAMTLNTGKSELIQVQQTPVPAHRRTSSGGSPNSTVEPRMPSYTLGHKRQITPNYDPSVNAKPYSPFYRHATPNFSADKIEYRLRREAADLEAGDSQTTTTRELQPQNLHRSKLWEKKRRCIWWRRMNRGTRFVLKIALAIVIVGGMVGIAVGVTAAVSGGG